MTVSSKNLNVRLANIFKDFLESNNGTRFRMMFMTSHGIITGVLQVPNSNSYDFEEFIRESFEKSFDLDLNAIKVMKMEYIEDADEEIDFIGDGNFIVLTKVKIYKNTLDEPMLKLSSFLLHTEDIIGLSYVPEESEL